MGKTRADRRNKMEVDAAAPAKEAGWETGAGAAMDTAEGGFGVVEGGGASAPASTAGGDAAAGKSVTSRGFGIVVGGVKKKKVQMSFKQKRRKNKKIEKAVARSERTATTQKKKGLGRDRKNELKHLW